MNLPMPVAVGIWIVLGLLLLLVIWRGLRSLRGRGADVVPALPAVPEPLGAATFGPVEATYVSTTLHGDWLARVGAHGLGDRAGASVSVHPEGVLVERTGAPTLFVPAERLQDAGTTAGMAGKYVGGEGIAVMTWAEGAGEADGRPATLLDTGLRTRRSADRTALLDAIRALVRPTDHGEEPA
ncbi:hypothetical protein CLV28_1704 [Sediminihabitans luteus]|uniref:PH domain-containing protein n=1 Tax=Sediminihabitans luteus TaxID=1138585 RepID=A0A2M9CQJ6_9CELL|nr:hypothetical protein [Sediminihabitans luteus]PJJ74210.1 hypothetical protein CLV28_1704 [Sediminihabitans luteus]GII99063.1 hypothetical protein Slu03_14410 [Sediminihabitans luteus]